MVDSPPRLARRRPCPPTRLGPGKPGLKSVSVMITPCLGQPESPRPCRTASGEPGVSRPASGPSLFPGNSTANLQRNDSDSTVQWPGHHLAPGPLSPSRPAVMIKSRLSLVRFTVWGRFRNLSTIGLRAKSLCPSRAEEEQHSNEAAHGRGREAEQRARQA